LPARRARAGPHGLLAESYIRVDTCAGEVLQSLDRLAGKDWLILLGN
jgi:hypothetical protein